MDAIVYHGVKDVGVEKVPDPRIEKENNIIVKVTSTAICASDLHLIQTEEPAACSGTVTPSADIREDRHSICGFLTPM